MPLDREKAIKIANLLISDPRMPTVDVAKSANMNRNACKDIIYGFFSEKYLQLSLNPTKSKYKIYKFILIKLEKTTASSNIRISKKLLLYRNVLGCYMVEGDYTYMVIAGFEKQDEYEHMIRDLQGIEFWETSSTITVACNIKQFGVSAEDIDYV